MAENARPARSYDLQIPGLEEAIAAAVPHKSHKHALAALHKATGEPGWALATTRDEGAWWSKRKVLTKTGAIVAEDHESWLRIQLAADGGDMAVTRRRLQVSGFQLSKCHISEAFFTLDRGGDQWNFSQVRCALEHEVIDRPLFNEYDRHRSYAGEDFKGFVRDAEDGYEHPSAERTAIRPDTYTLTEAIDLSKFMLLLDEDDARTREETRKRMFKLSSMGGDAPALVPYSRLDPNWERYPHKARRLGEDWAASSAGQSGARLSRSWIAKANDYTDPSGQRWLSYIPMWTHTVKLAAVDATKGSDYELYGKLQKIDARVGVPFAWYFYMLHGNRVTDTAGERVLAAAEKGLIVLPEHDYQVLRRWRERPYGF